MKKILVDTNVILDVHLHRVPFYDDARGVNKLVEQHKCAGYISSSAMTDIFYLARKELKDSALVYKIMDTLAADFVIAPVLESTIKGALALRWKDFEDAVQYMTAKEHGVSRIVTRNYRDFEALDIPCVSPAGFLADFREAAQE